MHIMTAEGWKPLVFRSVTPAGPQNHWNSAELKAGVDAFFKKLSAEVKEMQADRIDRHGKDIFAK